MPTIVLMHGGWADSSGWNGEISRLEMAGCPVIAPANPLRGLTSDADEGVHPATAMSWFTDSLGFATYHSRAR